jgi:hypothetical protein
MCKVICEHYRLLYKRLKCPQILVSTGVLEPILHRHQGTSVPGLSRGGLGLPACMPVLNLCACFPHLPGTCVRRGLGLPVMWCGVPQRVARDAASPG